MTATLTQFTDPFCTWSWGAEPLLRRVEETYGDQVELRFVMGGLIEDFETFYDEANDIAEPADVAPHWEEAAAKHGMPVDADVWLTDPPQSSYPANVAYEAATFQGIEPANRYLRRLRAAFAAERGNIEREDVLVELAGEVGLDVDRFRAALDSDRARAAFERDRALTRERGATVFPSFLVEGPEGERLLRGSQPFDELAGALEAVAPGLERQEPRPLAEFVRSRGRVAAQEVAEVYGLDRGAAREALRGLEDEGHVRAERRGSGHFWTAH